MRSAMSARISRLLPLLGGRGGRVGGCGGCRRAEAETFRLLFALRFLLPAEDGEAACLRALSIYLSAFALCCRWRSSGTRQSTAVGGSRASVSERVGCGLHRAAATATSLSKTLEKTCAALHILGQQTPHKRRQETKKRVAGDRPSVGVLMHPSTSPNDASSLPLSPSLARVKSNPPPHTHPTTYG